MQIFWEIIRAEAAAGLNITETVTLPIQPHPGATVLVTAALQRVNQTGENGQAEVGISAYDQDGKSNEGNWPVVEGENITRVVSYLRVASAQATATVVTFVYD